MSGVGITNNSKLDGILTDYNAKYSEVFSRNLMTTYQHFCGEVTTNNEKYETVFYQNWPVLRKWNSGRQYKALTAQSVSVTLEPYEKSMEIDWVRYLSDPAGLARAIDAVLANMASELDKVVFDKLIAGTTDLGHDGVAWFSASHTVAGSSVSNTDTTSFSEARVRTVIQAMKLITDDNSEPLGIEPSVLVVGPRHFHKAKEIFDANVRFVGLSAAGVEATASVVTAAAIPNVWQGELLVVESKRLSGSSTQYHYFLFDTTKPNMPMELVQHARAPLQPDNDLSEFMGANPAVKLGAKGILAVALGPWQLAYGSFATS